MNCERKKVGQWGADFANKAHFHCNTLDAVINIEKEITQKLRNSNTVDRQKRVDANYEQYTGIDSIGF